MKPSAATSFEFEEYERWIFEDIVPKLAADGKMTEEKLNCGFYE